MSKKVTRKGSGRTTGSYSFVNITLADLTAKLGADPTTPIVVRRKWAEGLGFTGLVAKPVNNSNDVIPCQKPQGAIVQMVDLEAEDAKL